MTPERFEKINQVLSLRQIDLTVVMENVQTPHNLAAIARTCDAVGIPEAHAVTDISLIDLKQRAASGSRKWVNIITHNTIGDVFERLRAKGFQILTAHFCEDAVNFRDIDYTKPTAIVVGSELEGISEEAVEKADGSIIVPMLGMTQSLNVSVAAALILYEAQRQRELAGLYNQRQIENSLYSKLVFEWGYPKLVSYYKKKNQPYPEIDEDGYLVKKDEF